MLSDKKRIVNILGELVNNAIDAKSSNIDINIKREADRIEILIKDNGKGMDEETLKEVKRTLNQPYRKIYDEYYSGLGGTQRSDSGLNIVGFQIDKAEIESSPEGTTIKVIRKKDK